MRTNPPRILPGCPYCNNDHDPSITCRALVANPALELSALRDANRKLLRTAAALDPHDPARCVLYSAYSYLNDRPRGEARPGFHVDYALQYGVRNEESNA